MVTAKNIFFFFLNCNKSFSDVVELTKLFSKPLQVLKLNLVVCTKLQMYIINVTSVDNKGVV